jgi:chromatin remodeling complex protein RSC6
MYNMPKQSKASKTTVATESATSVVAPAPIVAAPAPAVAEVVVKKEKKVKAAKTETAAPVVAAPATPAPVVETVVEASTAAADAVELDSSLIEKSADFVAKLQQIATLMASLKTEYKSLEKQWSRDLKTAQKQSSKRKKRAGNRAPSGFVKPTKISDELAAFLEKPVGSEMARTEVTRDINTYIRTNSLQDKENGRKIIPDTKLSALLKIAKGEELTYFNLQRYMSPHFSKANKPPTAQSAV